MPMILIPTYHQGQKTEWLLRSCIESIRDNCPRLLKATLIIDDASPEFPFEFYDGLQREFGVSVMKGNENLGYSHNINRGLRAACRHGIDWVLTLNNDCLVKSDFIDTVNEVFEADPDISVIGGKLYFPTGRVQACGFEVTDRYLVDMYESGAWTHDAVAANAARYVMGVTGAMQFIRISHLANIGLYDESYPMGFEDVDFCLRTWTEGGRVFYQPSIYGVHFESATRGHWLGERECQSLDIFHEKCGKLNLADIRSKVSAANLELQLTLSSTVPAESDSTPRV